MGNVLNNPVYAAFWGNLFYRNIVSRYTYVLDGEKQTEEAFYLLNEIEIIQNIWKETSFSICNSATFIIRFWLLGRVLVRLYPRHIFNIKDEQLARMREDYTCFHLLLSVVELLDEALSKTLSYLSQHSLVLESISFIALSYLGFYPTAISGLTFLALSELKKRGLINQKTQSFLRLFKVCINTMFIWNFTAQIQGFGIVFRSILYFQIFSDYIGFITDHIQLEKTPYFGKFFSKEKPSALKSLQFVANLDGHVRSQISTLQVEEEYVFEEFPLVKEIEESSYTAIIKKLEDRLIKENIFFTDLTCYKGYHNFKNCLQTGAIFDGTIPDSTLLKNKIAMSFDYLTMQSPENFRIAFLDLCEKGECCSVGWIEALTYFSEPEFASIKKQVLYHLAIFRDEILKESCLQICDNKDQACNVHVVQDIAEYLFFHFPTYTGAFLNKQDVPFIRKILNTILSKIDKNFPVLTDVWVVSAFAYFDSPLKEDFFEIFNSEIAESRDLQKIIFYLDSKITPQKKEDIVHRQISWSLITSWMNSHSGITFYDESGWDPYWVKKIVLGEKEHYTLTENGIRLLLWDLGVLKPRA